MTWKARERTKRWVQKQRENLIKELGGKCSLCGSTDSLEFDHPKGRAWEPKKKSQHCRISKYTKEAKKGEIRILCSNCNKRNQPRTTLNAC